MIQLICIDIDGTLLNSKKELPEENIRAIRYAIDKGAIVAFATGRSRQGVDYLFESIPCEGNAICLNSGLILYEGEIIYQRAIDESVIEKVINLMEKHQSQLFLTEKEGNITVGCLSEKLKQEMQQGSLKGNYRFCEDYKELRQVVSTRKILKMAVQDFEAERFEQLYEELCQIKEISVLRSDRYFLDIIPADSGKEKGIEILTEYLGISEENVLSIGDNENDIAMLKQAKFGVAMGNAAPEVKQAADYVTADQDHAGVAEAIYHYLSDTEKIQQRIDEVAENGGGEVLLPAGEYHISSLRLYSNITLHLSAGTKLYGSTDYRDYTDFHVPTTMKYVTDPEYKEKWNLPDYYIYGMFCAFGAENVAIIGEKGSLIDGRDCYDANGEEKFRGPMGIIFSSCKNVTLKGYTFVNSANWSHQIDGCEQVEIADVTIQAGHDGFNLHHCTGVRIQNCHLETGDDCLAGYDVEDLQVSDCYFNTACNSMRIGGTNLKFSKCRFEVPGKYPHLSEKTYHTHAMFKYYAIGADTIRRDGENIEFKDCKFTDINQLLMYRHGEKSIMQDNRPLRDLRIEQAVIEGLTKTGYFLGNGENCSLTMKNVNFGKQLDCPDDVILELDAAAQLKLENVTSEKPVKIRVARESKVEVQNCSGIEIVKKEG